LQSDFINMDYDIVVTLGPSSNTEAQWTALLEAGASAFRLNTSHLSLPQLDDWLVRLETFLSALGARPPLVLDLQGSKWRLGQFPACDLAAGQSVELVYALSAERPGVLPVPHPDFFQAAGVSSDELVLNDAKVRLARQAAGADWMTATVIQGGPLSSRKGITYAVSKYRQETLSETDRAILARTRGLAGLRYALSYVKDAGELARYRAQVEPSAYVIAKVERPSAVDDALQIAASADELWLCRGDLGAELGLRAMAQAAHRFAAQVRSLPVRALLAGQVLEHLVEHPTPTRSEVCALHDALASGYAGFVLSDETAVGRDPAAACRAAALFRN